MAGTPSADVRTSSGVPSSDPPSALTMTARASGKCARSPSAAACVTWLIVAALRKLGMPTTRSALRCRRSASRMSGSSAEERVTVSLRYRRVIDALDQFVLPFIDSLYGAFGYLGVVIAMSIESAAIPIPSEIILPFAGWSVSRGGIEPLTGSPWTYWGAVLAGVVGNTAGSLVSYAVGALGGRPLLERHGGYVLVSAHGLRTADRLVERLCGL